MKEKIFIIEHLEPKLWEWCFIEYKNISHIVGKENLWFTNIKSKKDKRKLEKLGRVFKESIKKIKLENACLLDPNSKFLLTPKKSKKFKYFIFGGILGNDPPENRTEKELSIHLKKIPTFNIGKKQMSTDNAVEVVKNIINGENLKEIKFVDKLEVKINEIETIILPYRYLIKNGKIFVSEELIKYLKSRKRKLI